MVYRKELSIILFILFFTASLYAQNLKITGTAKPGYALIGEGNNIEQAWLDEDKIQVDKSGMFIFSFDREEKGAHTLKVEYKDGTTEIKEFNLAEREYKIQRINSKKKQFSSPPEDELARIAKERGILKAARAKIGMIDTAYFRSGFMRPVQGGRITGVYGSQRILNGVPQNTHNGLDIAKPEGTPVYAMADGVVQLAGDNFYYNGSFVLIDHGQDLSSIYLHFSKLSVSTGDFVKKGQKIGEIGTTGRSTGPHTHWEIRWHGKRIDPVSIMKLEF